MRVIETERLLDGQLRQERLPHIWCPGCGHGIVTRALAQALDAVGRDERTVLVSGIGCSSRATGYFDYDTIHAIHGRAIALATGLKLARPDLRVIVIGGDGDTGAIGLSHLVHAARRNVDLTVLCYVNHTYGMTGGQGAPTTACGDVTSTSPSGHAERPLDLCALAGAAGAPYVARATAWHYDLLVELIARGIAKRGFSFVEALSPCPVYAGRLNGQETPGDMLLELKDIGVTDPQAKLGEGQVRIGELVNVEAPEPVERRGEPSGRSER
jgi:2-oxoglutarate/2-oxoacid ferredoxin oxidoreductase subunit beta